MTKNKALKLNKKINEILSTLEDEVDTEYECYPIKLCNEEWRVFIISQNWMEPLAKEYNSETVTRQYLIEFINDIRSYL